MNDNVKNALIAIDNAKQRGALTYISREDCMAVTPLFKPETTVFEFNITEDMHNISGKYAPKREIVDRIGEASGIEFVREGCLNKTETRDDSLGKRVVYISEQQVAEECPTETGECPAFRPTSSTQFCGRWTTLML